MKSLLKNTPFPLLMALLLTLAACGDVPPPDEPGTADTTATAPRVAVAELAPASGSNVEGTVTFTEQDENILVVAQVRGLEPGRHGFHIHEHGDCSAPDASSAGGHFAPLNDPHGAPSEKPGERHVGDFGNLVADSSGVSEYRREDNVIAFEGERSIIGKAVIIHQEADDLTSQPSGAAGPRIACGVIEMEMTS